MILSAWESSARCYHSSAITLVLHASWPLRASLLLLNTILRGAYPLGSVCCLLFCCCSRSHQVDSCKLTCSIKRSHEQQQWYSTCLKRRTHTTVKLTYYSRLPSTRFSVINQVLAGMSGQNREPNTPVGGFDSKSKVVGEDCRPRTTVGHL